MSDLSILTVSKGLLILRCPKKGTNMVCVRVCV